VGVTATALASGDVNCPNGGSKFVSANATTYACDGKDGIDGTGGFNGSFTSPNGKYKLRITDNGIFLTGPGGSVSVERTIVRVSDGTPWAGRP
jgi:hypothetical protein